jgi:hypothetical protein
MPGDTLTLSELAEQLDKTLAVIPDLASQVLRKISLDVVDYAQFLVVVDTGATMNSIDARGPGGAPLAEGDLEAIIGPSTWYAPLIEFGDPHHGPRPFMRPAAEMHEAKLVAAAERIGYEALVRPSGGYITTSPKGKTYTRYGPMR